MIPIPSIDWARALAQVGALRNPLLAVTQVPSKPFPIPLGTPPSSTSDQINHSIAQLYQREQQIRNKEKQIEEIKLLLRGEWDSLRQKEQQVSDRERRVEETSSNFTRRIVDQQNTQLQQNRSYLRIKWCAIGILGGVVSSSCILLGYFSKFARSSK